MILTNFTAAGSTRFTKTDRELCGSGLSTDCTNTIVRMKHSRDIRRPRACRAAQFVAFWKIESADCGLAPTEAYPGSIPRPKHSETTMYPTACKAMSSVLVVIRAK